MSGFIDRPFGVRAAGSTPGREILGGLTTFLTMSYIAIVNPVFLSAAGIPGDSAVLATLLGSAVATILMGLVANLPIALAPGMGLNAFFAYTICVNHQVPWRVGLGLLAWVAIVFVLLTVGRVRTLIAQAVPRTLRYAAAVGIGLFITTIGLQHAGVVAPDPATIVSFGDVTKPHALLAIGGLAVTLALAARHVRTAIFGGMVVTAVSGVLLGLLHFEGPWLRWPAWSPPGLEMDLFRIPRPHGDFPSLGRALAVDAVSGLFGAGLGTSTVTCYIESATGVSVGARTGLANLVTGGCFLASLFLIPLVAAVGVPVVSGGRTYFPVTAPALIVVGVLMARTVIKIEWGEISEAVPAFLTMIVMPATFNISHGLAAGFVTYTGMKLVGGKGREVHWLVYVIAALLVGRYLLLPLGG